MENKKVILEESERILTVNDLLEAHSISMDEWDISKQYVNSWENVSKNSDGDPVVTPLYQVKVVLDKKQSVEDLQNIRNEFIDDLKKISPNIKQYKYKKDKSSKLLQLNLFDLHLGKVAWFDEVGYDYNLDIAEKIFNDSISYFCNLSQNFSIDKILLPIGNDFFNSDTSHPINSTTAGTPQEESNRWQEVFRRGRILIVNNVNKLSKIAPVHIVMVPGNHDYERNFFLGDSLEGWFHNNKNVYVDNRPNPRKYFKYESVLIGFTHGNNEKIQNLPLIMAQESKEWSDSKWREFHIGHWHGKKDIKYLSTDEYNGVRVRYMGSLSATDSWHHKKGYIGNNKTAEAFVWDKVDGLVANFYYNNH